MRATPRTQGSKTGQVYDRLKSVIVLQKLPPRTPLEMKNIAESFGVSITPVREALILLANEGIIAKDSTRSYVTRALNSREVQNDYEAAFMIARYCVENAIKPFVATGLRFVDARVPDNPTAQDNAQIVALAIEALYERLAGLTENERMVRLMLELKDRTSFVRQLYLQDQGRLDASISAMTSFIQYVEVGEIEKAIGNLKKQYQRKYDVIPDLVREGNIYALEAVDIFNKQG
ncbi:GntR family transcriptional regulator [Mesorhizobium huakuii]|uniref:GntR family transcriptional regulator n=1 Tax=Mesorhizobium huakuii TaxID=28104 RepID=A0A7G6T571_9HYPH|nr:GntR family transcriptional regulator [Mesorhizobium huakuii]QND61903.1 GntR family transcriptional regulator [Mesorhizobium huakuii]QND69265.1 GntR family transcriptional regulator [Mesorhizobium loti]